jgi:MoaA/NifB/PqqE/SkfB family radical SAM enzyme
MGGEPLYHKKFIKFIDWCIDNNKTDFHLTFVTNGTIHNQALLEKLKLFKSIQVEISLENLHETNNYIRLNSDFAQVRENILNIFNCLGTSSVVIRSVPQALSIMHYDTLIDFAIENKISIDNNVIYNPEYLKCLVLPKEVKDKLVTYLQHKYANILGNGSNDITTQISRIRTFEFNLKRHIESLLIQLNEPEPSNVEDLRKQFIEYNDKMDSVSGTSFKEMYPELLNFYAKYSTI